MAQLSHDICYEWNLRDQTWVEPEPSPTSGLSWIPNSLYLELFVLNYGWWKRNAWKKSLPLKRCIPRGWGNHSVARVRTGVWILSPTKMIDGRGGLSVISAPGNQRQGILRANWRLLASYGFNWETLSQIIRWGEMEEQLQPWASMCVHIHTCTHENMHTMHTHNTRRTKQTENCLVIYG